LSPLATELADVLDAFGRDIVLLESMGTSQVETRIRFCADSVVVVLTPETGDEVQSLKSGLLEVADIVAINKSDRPGAESLARTSIGFTKSTQAGDEMADIKRMFTPEFRNRLDATISFGALDRDVILRVVDKFLMQLEAQLQEKKVEAVFTDALKAHLAKNGFDPLMGARPMARLIQDTIRSALADELLFGRLASGGRVTVDVDADGKVKLEFEEEAAAV
jgi:hypothetical protein